jgi:hypothetical protein
MMRLSESKRERALILPSESIFAVFRRQRYGEKTKCTILKSYDFAAWQPHTMMKKREPTRALRLVIVIPDEQAHTSKGQQELKGNDKDVYHTSCLKFH